MMTERTYWESVDFVLSQILLVSSNVRSASLIAPTGVLRRFKLREDVNLLLNTREMGELVNTAMLAASSFYKFLPKLGILRYMYLDFENLHTLIFPMPDKNILFITIEKTEHELTEIVNFINKLLEREGMVYPTS